MFGKIFSKTIITRDLPKSVIGNIDLKENETFIVNKPVFSFNKDDYNAYCKVSNIDKEKGFKLHSIITQKQLNEYEKSELHRKIMSKALNIVDTDSLFSKMENKKVNVEYSTLFHIDFRNGKRDFSFNTEINEEINDFHNQDVDFKVPPIEDNDIKEMEKVSEHTSYSVSVSDSLVVKTFDCNDKLYLVVAKFNLCLIILKVLVKALIIGLIITAISYLIMMLPQTYIHYSICILLALLFSEIYTRFAHYFN